MGNSKLDFYKAGYMEARAICIGRLRRIAARKDRHLDEIVELIAELEEDEEKDHWENIQEEFPGITVEEYEAMCEHSAKQIREKYYNKNGKLKLEFTCV